jgi:DNA polymerase III alpha subunit
MIRTGFSFRTAVGHVNDVVERVKEIGWDVLPIVDRASTFGFVEATKAAKAAGLRPLYGVEIAVSPEPSAKRPVFDHWKFLARGSIRAIHDVVWRASQTDMRLPYDVALSMPDVTIVSGERLLIDNVPRKFPANFYFGLSPATPKGLAVRAMKRGLRPLAIGDNLYPRAEDLEFYRVTITDSAWYTKWEDRTSATTQTYPQWIVSDDEWRAAVARVADPATMTTAIRNRGADLLSPPKKKTLRQLCVDGAKALGVDLSRPEYRDRLEHELRMIDEKKFADYFHILADMIAWSKKRMIVGPARGSSCGSLVCYLTGITTIDPLPYGLMFERFIDVTRADLPDVDVDFSDERRAKMFQYVTKKYGADHVARLGNVGSFQAKSALNRVAQNLQIPKWRVEKVAASIIQRAQGDNRSSQTIEDTLATTEVGRALVEEFPEIGVVARLEDHPTVASQHAAGVLITSRPILDHVAVNHATGAAMCDKKDAEALNLLKIDALGLTQLSVFERTLDLIGVESVSGWLEKLPLDDPKAFDVLNRKQFAGIFQFVGQQVRSLALALLRHSKFRELNDIVALTALARPGPMGSGGSDEWIRRRTGQQPTTYAHDLFKPYLGDTHGVIVYQEQVMAIGREIGGLSWGEVNELRRAMSRSLGREFFDKFGDKWKAGAIERGLPKEILDKFWADLCNFGAMGFNKSHSVAYGVVSYWCCWLKAHHPMEFCAATLDTLKSQADQVTMLRELKDEGVDYIPIDVDKSIDRWVPIRKDKKRYLLGPLTLIDGVGPKKVQEIIEARKSGAELKPAVKKFLEDARTDLDSLYPIRDRVAFLRDDAAKRYEELRSKNEPLTEEEDAEMNNCRLIGRIESEPLTIDEIIRRGNDLNDEEILFIGVISKVAPTNENGLTRVQKRGGRRVTGPEMALHSFFRDDTGEIFCKVERRDYERVGRAMAERGKKDKAIYALKGRVWSNADFQMIWINRARYLGDMERA